MTKSKVLRTLKCAISIFDLSLTLNWEKAREDFEISLSIYQLSFSSYNFFSESSSLYASESTVGEDAVLSKQFICLLPDTHKVCPEEIFQSIKPLVLDGLSPLKAKRKMLLPCVKFGVT